jgi:butyryl-CoA dehydrogenase
MDQLVTRRDVEFLLYELLDVDRLTERQRFSEHDRATFDAVIDAAHTLAAEKFATHASKLDQNEPSFDGRRVDIIPEVKEALDAYVDAGFIGAAMDVEYGGMQLPWTIAQACAAYFCAANISTVAYPFLTVAACNMLASVGSEEQKEKYLKPMVAGRYFGTMCLSETQAGSSLSDIRTTAAPTDKDHYLINGSKMWISCGEHELSENIVHMVLAKIPGGPPGVKGISLFVVPKFRVNDDGTPGEYNNVVLAGLNHKMGYRGTVNTVLNFGEGGPCHGFLVGQPHAGLSYMFHMMNEARVGVGLGGAALGYAGYLHSLQYARERPQGRHPQDKDPNSPQVSIIEHADIRRLLLAQKAAAEGAFAFVLYCAYLLDLQHTTESTEQQKHLGLLLDILTPIAKSWPAEFCLEANKHAIQIMGGYGYTHDYPVERFYRDNRLNPIHEGTHGIHAIDLLGRKVTMQGGAALDALFAEIDTTFADARAHPELVEFCEALSRAMTALRRATEALLAVRAQGNGTLYLANAGIYLDMFGHTVIGWMWLRQACVAAAALPGSCGDDRNFYTGKIKACQYFCRYELPKVAERAALLAQADDTCLAMADEWF